MLDTSEIEAALAERSEQNPVELSLHVAADHPLNDQLVGLAAQLEEVGGGRVVVRREQEDAELPARPALVLHDAGRPVIRYLAAPEGPEAAPFLEAVCQIGTETPAAEAWQKQVAELADPIEVIIFIAAACPNCPHTVRAATGLSLLSPAIRTTVIDAQFFPELAKSFGARSVPLTVVDGGLSITGAWRGSELAEKLLARGTPAYEAEVFASLITVGRFADAAQRLVDGSGREAFAAGWRGSALSERMGLMMAAEAALELEVGALDELLPALVEILGTDGADAALRGDTADLLGKIALPGAVEPLRGLLGDANPDVVEIAEEALEAIAEAGRK